MDLSKVVQFANQAGRESRRPGAPILTEASTLDQLVMWLEWNDPNGQYTEDFGYSNNETGEWVSAVKVPALTLEEAWAAIAGEDEF